MFNKNVLTMWQKTHNSLDINHIPSQIIRDPLYRICADDKICFTNYPYKFINLTFNKIGFVARRINGFIILLDVKVLTPIKKWRSKITIPCPLISRWYWICNCLQDFPKESFRASSKKFYKKIFSYCKNSYV